MGWLLREIAPPHFGITYSETMIPENPDSNVYEITEADSLVKPQAQLDAEAASMKAEIKALAKAILTANTPDAILFRNINKYHVVRHNTLLNTLKDTCETSTNANLRLNLITALPDPNNESEVLSAIEALIDAEL